MYNLYTLNWFIFWAFTVLCSRWVCGTYISYEVLTICCHANSDALFETTFLALVPCYFVYHAFSFIFTGIAWVKIFLNSSPEKALTMEKYIVTVCGLEKKNLNLYCQYSTVSNANYTKTICLFNFEVRWLHDPWVSAWDIEDFWPKFSIHWASPYTKPPDIVIQHFIHVISFVQLQLSSLCKTNTRQHYCSADTLLQSPAPFTCYVTAGAEPYRL